MTEAPHGAGSRASADPIAAATGEASPTSGPGSGWRSLVRAATIDVGPLRTSRDFRLLFFGQAVSFAGSMITYVAVPFQVFRLTHSSLAVGLLSLVELAPLLVAALVGGALADAHDRRRLVLLSELGLACVSAVLAVNALLPVRNCGSCSSPRRWRPPSMASSGRPWMRSCPGSFAARRFRPLLP